MPEVKNKPPLCRDCSARAIPGYRYCAYHLERERLRQTAAYRLKRSKGLCCRPGCEVVTQNYLCDDHERVRMRCVARPKGVVRGKRL